MKITDSGYIYQDEIFCKEIISELEETIQYYPYLGKKKKDFSIILAGGTISSWGYLSRGVVVDSEKSKNFINKLNTDIFKNQLNYEFINTTIETFSENTTELDYKQIFETRTKFGKKISIVFFGTDKLVDLACYYKLKEKNENNLTIFVGSMKNLSRPGCEIVTILSAIKNLVYSSKGPKSGSFILSPQADGSCILHYPEYCYKFDSFARGSFKSKNNWYFAKIVKNKFEWNYNSNYRYTKGQSKEVIVLDDRFTDYTFLKPYNLTNKVLMIKGSGLGHINENNLELVEQLNKHNSIIITTSCITGPIRGDVYSSGRKIRNKFKLNIENFSDVFLFYFLKGGYTYDSI